MNEHRKQFAARLLAADVPAADARQRYEKEMRAMFEKTLTPGERSSYLVGAILMAAPALGCGFAAYSIGFGAFGARPHGPEDVKFAVAFFLLTGGILAVVAGIIFHGYWTGIVKRRISNQWAAGAGVAFLGLSGWCAILFARVTPESLRDEVQVFGLVLLLYAAVAWVRHSVAQAEMNTAERLLQIELRLAELSESRDA